jgi:large subunit ribosomal protein L10
LAISKERKAQLLEEYIGMLKGAQGVVITEYRGMTMKQLDDLRAKLRDFNSGLTITKNTLLKIALKEVGMAVPDHMLVGPVALAIAYQDMPKTITAVLEHSGTNDLFIVKGGIIGADIVKTKDLDAISKLPSLEVLRAQLVGTIVMPLTQFMSLLEEPGRQIVAVIQAATDGSVNVFAAYSPDEAA